MFKRILMPLDGSRLAESALPVAESLGRCLGATLVLFHVIERGVADAIHGERHLAQTDAAEAYLETVALGLRQAGLTVEQHVHAPGEADVAHSIIDHTQDLQTGLVLLCAHGRGGLRDVFVGNIAQQVIQGGRTPVFFVRPETIAARGGRYECRKILLPLDLGTAHEAGLPAATHFARQCEAALHVMTAAPTTRTLDSEQAPAAVLMPTATAAVLDMDARQARQHLQEVVRGLDAQGIVADGSVARGDAAASVLQTARDRQVDLIVLATHARAALEARWGGSVAPKVLARAVAPLLLVRQD